MPCLASFFDAMSGVKNLVKFIPAINFTNLANEAANSRIPWWHRFANSTACRHQHSNLQDFLQWSSVNSMPISLLHWPALLKALQTFLKPFASLHFLLAAKLKQLRRRKRQRTTWTRTF